MYKESLEKKANSKNKQNIIKSEVKTKNINLKSIIIDVARDDELSDNTGVDKYMALFLLSFSEVAKDYGLNLKDLKRVLVNQENQLLGFVFKYIDNKDLEEYKVTLISPKISKKQIDNMINCLPDNAYVSLATDEGFFKDGKVCQIKFR